MLYFYVMKPKATMCTTNLHKNEGNLVLPQPQPRYSLEDLLEQCDSDAPITDEDRTWLDLKPVGFEL